MRLFSGLVAIAIFTAPAQARVWTSVYRHDEVTPLAAVDANRTTVYRNIMVGTRLVFVISSDSDRSWSGCLVSSWEDSNCGVLNARGEPDDWNPYPGSCFDAAGRSALIDRYGGMGVGYALWSGDNFGVPAWDPVAGAWFILDYQARKAGPCDVVLYSHVDGARVPVETLSFAHVLSRDFNNDNRVNFEDLAMLLSQQGAISDSDPNSPGAGLDLNSDQQIDAQDLALFSEYWLEQTDSVEAATDPNDSAM